MSSRRRYSAQELRAIYDRTSGKCHLCHKKLAFTNYGRNGERAAWHVDHSRAKAKGGSDHGNNLRAACIRCNIEKSTTGTRAVRAWNGKTRAPLSKTKRAEAKRGNALAGGALGAGIGAMVAGPPGLLLGGLVGLAVGHDGDPDH